MKKQKQERKRQSKMEKAYFTVLCAYESGSPNIIKIEAKNWRAALEKAVSKKNVEWVMDLEPSKDGLYIRLFKGLDGKVHQDIIDPFGRYPE